MATSNSSRNEFNMRYLGSAPVKAIGEEVTKSAINLLMIKLQKLQKKMVDKYVMKQHGTRLSDASPVYQKLAEKLSKNDLDCTRGDPVRVTITSEVFEMKDLKSSEQGTCVRLNEVLSLTLLPGQDESSVLFSFIQEPAPRQLQCHVLLCPKDDVDAARVTLSTMIRAAAKAPSATGKGKGLLGRATKLEGGEPDNVITFGVGLRRKSSLKVSGGLRRKGTVNLKGATSGEVKRRSSTYGNTFASFGAPMPGTAAHEAVPASAVRGDDLFDDIDDDIFGNVDSIEEGDDLNSFVSSSNNTGVAGTQETGLDFSGFGFDGEDNHVDVAKDEFGGFGDLM
eukprot:m.115631 g.115631  ORF g.115631 m.115631 type:complete len:338 (+) comp17149_c0_seq1:240-1253(+)